jgi:hypothetical protein
LEEKAGWPRGRVFTLEKRKRAITIEQAVLMAVELDVPLEYLLRDVIFEVKILREEKRGASSRDPR